MTNQPITDHDKLLSLTYTMRELFGLSDQADELEDLFKLGKTICWSSLNNGVNFMISNRYEILRPKLDLIVNPIEGQADDNELVLSWKDYEEEEKSSDWHNIFEVKYAFTNFDYVRYEVFTGRGLREYPDWTFERSKNPHVVLDMSGQGDVDDLYPILMLPFKIWKSRRLDDLVYRW